MPEPPFKPEPKPYTCAHCRRPLTERQARRVPPLFAWIAAFALAIGHGGLWAKSELARVYCSRCLVKVLTFVMLLVSVMLGLAAVGTNLWLTAPKLR